MSERNRLCVYTHSANGQIFYVGQGNARRPHNFSAATRGTRWRAHVERHGRPKITIHAWADNRTEAQRIEAELIAAYNPPCNVRRFDCRTYTDARPDAAPIAFRIRPTLKQALAKAAAADRRSVSGMVEILLEEALKARGYFK
jgi:hypothetical protein